MASRCATRQARLVPADQKFTRRKRWPQLLLQELTSSALFCLKPVPGGRGSVGSSDGKSGQNMGWKVGAILGVCCVAHARSCSSRRASTKC